MAVSAEASEPEPLRGSLVGVSVAMDASEVWYLPFGHQTPFTLTFEGEEQGEEKDDEQPQEK